MSEKPKQGIISSGAEKYLTSLKIELKQKRDEFRAIMANPTISEEEKDKILEELEKLEKDFKEKSKKVSFSLF